jgi:hypothetical protein
MWHSLWKCCIDVIAGLVGTMIIRTLSVSDLEEHWRAIEGTPDGEYGPDQIPLRCLPPWPALCAELGWSLHLARGGYFTKKRHGYCGVYRLIALDAERDPTKTAALDRVCGRDSTGTLYIGQADKLHVRLNDLRRSRHGAMLTLKVSIGAQI